MSFAAAALRKRIRWCGRSVGLSVPLGVRVPVRVRVSVPDFGSAPNTIRSLGNDARTRRGYVTQLSAYMQSAAAAAAQLPRLPPPAALVLACPRASRCVLLSLSMRPSVARDAAAAAAAFGRWAPALRPSLHRCRRALRSRRRAGGRRGARSFQPQSGCFFA